ncbi:RNA-binding protein 15 [Ambystoma mexicanum]|uniref:RNA-binding protein 15 n=1 Tax=Ambystoma mexicanum TaxID=8296 RepID=UPI0037E86EAC
MKGKERSPAKGKRSRGEERDRGARNKPGGGGGSNGSSAKSDGGRRGGQHQDKGRAGSREYESRYGSSGGGGKGGGRGGSSGAPEGEYKTLRISELGSALSDGAVEDGLFHEFKRFGDVSVKMSRAGDERVAFVNFRRPEDARAAKHARGRLVLYDRPLKIEAVHVPAAAQQQQQQQQSSSSSSRGNRRPSRTPEPAQPPPPPPQPRHRALSPAGLGYRDYRLQQLALGRLPPPPPLPRDLEPPPPPPERDFGFYEGGGGRSGRPGYAAPPALEPRLSFREADDLPPPEDRLPNRTLFLGNLDVSVTEAELRRHFQRFGAITEVDIKRCTPGQHCTYGFLKFENLDMAHRAKLAMHGKVIQGNPIKIGYGKATPSSRLWVGGLGPWAPLASLAREFDRFGTIRTIDYRKGDSWAYIQYESLDAAAAACSLMRGFPLGGQDRRLRVDFAETEHHFQPPFLQPLPLPPPHYDMVGDSFGHRAPEPLRPRERSPPLLYRDRERCNLYPEADWAPARERNRPPYEPLEPLDRRRDNWSLERERDNRDSRDNREQPPPQPRKRRLLDEGRHPERSPEGGGERPRKRPCASPERSPEGARYNDNDRPAPRPERSPPAARPRRGASQERGQGDKKDRKTSNSVERERKHRVPESKSPVKKEERPDNSKVKSPQKAEGPPKLGLAWQGMLLLKNSNFPSSMHLLQGDMNVASSLLVEAPSGGKVHQLKITQRLRLDQPKLDEVARRIKAAGPSGYAILLAVPGASSAGGEPAASTQRPLRNLVSYLKQKQAAGVISLPVGGHKEKENSGVLHAFPPCDFSQQFLDSSAKALAKSEDDFLVMVIVRGAS